jgi:hypothetical protein
MLQRPEDSGKIFPFALDILYLFQGPLFNVSLGGVLILTQEEQFPDLVQRKPKFLDTPDKMQPGNALAGIFPVARFCPQRLFDEALPFVDPDRFNIDPGPFGDLADGKSAHLSPPVVVFARIQVDGCTKELFSIPPRAILSVLRRSCPDGLRKDAWL